MSHHAPNHNLAFAAGGGEMGALLRAADWSGNPLGPLETWPQSLRTAVGLMLNARQPMYVAWGAGLQLLYNDAYRALLGARADHPEQVLGQRFDGVWADIWPQIAPVMEATLNGEAVHAEDCAFVVQRNGYPERIYGTYSTMPLRDESGAVAGVVCVCAETTSKVLSEHERETVLQELSTSNEKLRIAADAAGLGLFDHALQRGEIVWNARAREHFGLPADGPVTDAMIAAALHPDDRQRVLDKVYAWLDHPGDGRYRDEYRTVAGGDGRERWIEARGRVLPDAQGAPARLVGTTLDVTARRQAEAQAREHAHEAFAAAEANAKFRTFFEQGTQFASLMSPDGILLEVNHIALESGAERRQDVVGRPFWECSWWNGSAALMEAVRDCVRRAAAGEVVRRQLPYFAAGGCECYTEMTLAPVTGEDGALLFLAATGDDITEQRQVEERLRLLDAIGEATRMAHDPAAIMEAATRLLGEQMEVTRVAYADVEDDNDCFTIRYDWTAPGAVSTVGVYSLDLFGARARDAMRQGRTLRIDDVDRELDEAGGAAMFNRIATKAIICCPLVKDGRLAAMMAVHQARPRDWTDGEVALVEAVVERCWAHIERVRGAEALRASDRHKSEFLATLAHELRNPLAPIRNGIEIMKMGAEVGDSAPTPGKVLAMMERQVGHMVHLVDDLLDIARVSSGKLVLQCARIDLLDAINAAVEASRPAIDAAGHALVLQLPVGPVEVEADAVRISQVVGNLLSNAAKYTPRGGRIALALQVVEREAVVAVSDDGVGIAPDMLGAVFDMFTQVSRSIDRAGGGLGIGLSLVRRLVELHGGSVSADSAGIGKGSTFTVRLPLAARAELPAPASGAEPAAAHAQAGRRLRVLVADDNVDAAESLAMLLEIEGHQVRVAHDGVDAVAQAGEFAPELVFLDIGMPRMDGHEAARRLRMLPALDGALLVALTGWGAEDDRARSQAAGFDRHLLKPARPEDVHAVLEQVAAR